MPDGFNLTANVNLQLASGTLRGAISQIQSGLKGIKAEVDVGISSGSGAAINGINSQLGSLNANLTSIQGSASRTASAISNSGQAYSTLASSAANASRAVQSSVSSLQATTRATNDAANAASRFGEQAALAARRFGAFSLAAGGLIGLAASLRETITEANSFEREMIRLTQVGNDTQAQVKSIETEVTRLATTFGVSSKELLGAAVTFRQAGLSIDDTRASLEAIAKAALAPNFDGITKTVEGSIAAMQQFGIAGKDLETTLGSINAVAGDFAVEAGDLVTAVQRSGGAFKVAGGNLNELLALFTSVRQTTRESADSIATGLRTIFTRIQRNDTVDSLKQLGIELRYTKQEAASLGDLGLENQFVGPYEAVKRLSEGLKELRSTDPRTSAIIEELGGYRQIAKVIPLLQQQEVAQRALNSAVFGGYSITQSATQAQDAFLVKITKVKEEFLALGRSVAESKGFQEFLNGIVSISSAIATLTSYLTPLIPMLALLATIKIGSSVRDFVGGFSSRIGGGGSGTGATSGTRFATGGLVPGQGDGDTVPARLTPGEFVLNKQAVSKIGVSNLEKVNGGGRVAKFAAGGLVQRFAEGGRVDTVRFGSLGKDDPARAQATAAAQQAGIELTSATRVLIQAISATASEFKDFATKALGQGNLSTPQLKKAYGLKTGSGQLTDVQAQLLSNNYEQLQKISGGSGFGRGLTDESRSITNEQAVQNARNFDVSKYQNPKTKKPFTEADVDNPQLNRLFVNYLKEPTDTALGREVEHRNTQRPSLFGGAAGAVPDPTQRIVTAANARPKLKTAELQAQLDITGRTPLLVGTGGKSGKDVTNADREYLEGIAPAPNPHIEAVAALQAARIGRRIQEPQTLPIPTPAAPVVETPAVAASVAGRSARLTSAAQLLQRQRELNVQVQTPVQPQSPAQPPSQTQEPSQQGTTSRNYPLVPFQPPPPPNFTLVNPRRYPLVPYQEPKDTIPLASGGTYSAFGQQEEYPNGLKPKDIYQLAAERGRAPLSKYPTPLVHDTYGLQPSTPEGEVRQAGFVSYGLQAPGSIADQAAQNRIGDIGYNIRPKIGPENRLFEFADESRQGGIPLQGIPTAQAVQTEQFRPSVSNAEVLKNGNSRRTFNVDAFLTNNGSDTSDKFVSKQREELVGVITNQLRSLNQSLTYSQAEAKARQVAAQAEARNAELIVEHNGVQQQLLGSAKYQLAIESGKARQATLTESISRNYADIRAGYGASGVGGSFSRLAGGVAGRIGQFAGAGGLLALPFAAQGLESAGGTAENAVNGGSAVRFTAARGASGALGGASIGGTLGFAVAGPLGAAVGAAAGALYGLVSSLNDASKEIRDVKIANATNELVNRFKILANSSDLTGGDIGDIRGLVSQLQQDTTSKSVDSSSHLFTGLNAKEFGEAQTRNTREAFGGSVSLVAQVLTKQAQDIAKANPAAPVEELQKTFLEANGGFNREMVNLIASVQKIPVSQVEKQFTTTLNEAVRLANSTRESGRVQLTTNGSINAFERLVSNVQAASASLQRLSSEASTFSSLIEGQVTSTHAPGFSGSVGNIANPDSRAFREALGAVSGPLGAGGAGLQTSGTALNTVANVLPDILGKVVARGPVSEEGLGTQLTDELKNVLGSNNSEVNKVVQLVSNQFGKQDLSKLLQESGGDVSKLVDKLLSPLAGPFKDAVEKIARDLEAASNQFVDGLTRNAAITQRIGGEQDKLGTLQLNALRVRTNVEADQAGQKLSAPDLISLEQLQRPFQQSQERLTGLQGNNAVDPTAIAERLNAVLAQIPGAERQQQSAAANGTDNGQSFRAAAVALTNLKSEASNLQSALRNLADQSTRSAAIQEKLARIDQEREGRLSFGQRALTAGPEELANINQGLVYLSQAKQQGNFNNFTPEQVKLALGTGLSDETTVFGDTKYGDLRRNLVKNSAGGIFDVPADKQREESDLQKKLIEAEDARVKAQEQLIKTQSDLQGQFFAKQEQAQQKFFQDLARFELQRQLTVAKDDVFRARNQIGDLSKAQGDAGLLARAGITSDDQLRTFNSQRGNLENYQKLRYAQYGSEDQLNSVKDNFKDIVASIDSGLEGKSRNVTNVTGALKGALGKYGITDDTDIGSIAKVAENPFNNTSDFVYQAQNVLQKKIDDQNKPIQDARNKIALPDDQIDKIFGSGVGLDKLGAAAKTFTGTEVSLGSLNGKLAEATAQLDKFQSVVSSLTSQVQATPKGGEVQTRAGGGPIFRSRGTDTVPAMLTPGEFVVNAEAAKKNMDTLKKINSNQGVNNPFFPTDNAMEVPGEENPIRPIGPGVYGDNDPRPIEQRQGVNNPLFPSNPLQLPPTTGGARRRIVAGYSDGGQVEQFADTVNTFGQNSSGGSLPADLDGAGFTPRDENVGSFTASNSQLPLKLTSVGAGSSASFSVVPGADPGPRSQEDKVAAFYEKQRKFEQQQKVAAFYEKQAKFEQQQKVNQFYERLQKFEGQQVAFRAEGGEIPDEDAPIGYNTAGARRFGINLGTSPAPVRYRPPQPRRTPIANQDDEPNNPIGEANPLNFVRPARDVAARGALPAEPGSAAEELYRQANTNAGGASARFALQYDLLSRMGVKDPDPNNPDNQRLVGPAVAAQQFGALSRNLRLQQGLTRQNDAGARFGLGRPDANAQNSIAADSFGRLNQSNIASARRDFGFRAVQAGFVQGQQLNPFASQAQQPVRRAMGGAINGTDTVPAMLSPGEYVLNRSAVNSIGVGSLDKVNHFADGGSVPGAAGGASVDPSMTQAFTTFANAANTFGPSFSSSVNLLQSAFTGFGSDAKNLADVMSKFPNKLEMTGQQRLEVILNGAEVLTKLQPDLEQLIGDKISTALQKLLKDKLPDLVYSSGSSS